MPVVPIDWHALAEQVDDQVDLHFGETFTFIPWAKGQYVEGGADAGRLPLPSVGCYVSMTARVMTPGGTQGPAFNARLANVDALYSVRDKYIAQAEAVQGDRIEITDERSPRFGQTFEIGFIDPSDTDRSIIHLLRVKE